jgi:hypothetical protein
MAEEVKNPAPGQNNPNPAVNGEKTNQGSSPAGGSGNQGGTPQTVPYERLQEVIKQKNDLEAKLKEVQPTPTSPSSATGGDEAWKRKIELEISIPTYLKDKQDDILDYWGKYPNMPKADVYKVFTPAEQFAEMINQSNNQANQSRTGGTSNPAARQIDNKPLAQWEQKDLKSELETRLASGEKI